MLLNSVTLVAKPKNGKNKEITEKKAEKKVLPDTKGNAEERCELCKKEAEEDNFVFQFPTAVPSNSDAERCKNFQSYPGELVTIATGDALCLSVETFYYSIGLREESKADITCIFRKKVLETKTVPNGRVEIVVFALDCDQDFYITPSTQGVLELNYNSNIPRVQEPDERMFEVLHTNIGHVLIRPVLQKNMYLHHIDQLFSLQKLDMNWRCPEEYFFQFNAIPDDSSHKYPKRKVCTHSGRLNKTISSPPNLAVAATQGSNDTLEPSKHTFGKTFGENCSQAELTKDILDKYHVKLPTKVQGRRKRAISNLLFGCFSARSRGCKV